MANPDPESSDAQELDGVAGDDEPMDHGGIIDIERIPGGTWITSIRADLVTRYEGYMELDESEKVTVQRWGLGSIVSHWTMVLLMIVAILTGLAFWTGLYGPLDIGIWDGYQTAFQLHVWAGVLVAVFALVIFPFYHKVADGHNLLISVKQIKEQVVISFAFLGLIRYIPGYKQARRTYDEARDHWAGYHPLQTAFWYVTWFFVIMLTLTGFALWKALLLDPPWWIRTLGFMQGWLPYEQMLQLHLITTFLTIALVAVHAYVALLPGNRDIMGSMITGEVKAWVVDDETRPEPEDVTGETDESTGGADDDD